MFHTHQNINLHFVRLAANCEHRFLLPIYLGTTEFFMGKQYIPSLQVFNYILLSKRSTSVFSLAIHLQRLLITYDNIYIYTPKIVDQFVYIAFQLNGLSNFL